MGEGRILDWTAHHVCLYCGNEIEGRYEDCDIYYECECPDAKRKRQIEKQIHNLKCQFPKKNFLLYNDVFYIKKKKNKIMAKFEADGSIEMYITPQQFYDSCSLSEQLKLKCIIEDEFNLQEIEDDFITHGIHTCCGNCKDEDKIPRSLTQIEFNKSLLDLKESWYSLSKKEVQGILDIAKKHKIYIKR